MINVLICIGGLVAILLSAEVMFRAKLLSGEYLRKYVHILGATFIAFWPWLVSWRTIQILGLLMGIIYWANQRLKVLHEDGYVKRKTEGEILFAMTVVLLPLATHNELFFAIAILHMALADGLAAVVGTSFKNPHKYKVFGMKKSVYGTFAFWFTSTLILSIGLLFAGTTFTMQNYLIAITVLPLVLAALENLSPWGADNLTVPLVTVVALNALS